MKVLELLKETGGTGDSERTGLKGVIYEIKQKRRLSSHKPFESLSSVMAFRLLRFFFRLLCRLFSVRFYSLLLVHFDLSVRGIPHEVYSKWQMFTSSSSAIISL